MFLLQSTAHAYAGDYILIANASGPLVGAKKRIVKDAYLGKKRFHDGTNIEPVHLSEGPMKRAFVKEYLGMMPIEYKKHWVNLVFKEGLRVPRTIKRARDVLVFVKTKKGAVAYLPAENSGIVEKMEGVVIIGP
jgi:hypothetical protein